MPTQQEIQAAIDQIVTGAKYPANSMRPLLTSILEFASAGQTQVFDGLVANDTTMEDTTLVLGYGVNIVITSTAEDYACRLPVPVTGRRVTIVNRSTQPVFLFPDYNEGVAGRINNLLPGQFATIPPDSNAYDFTCIENPLPGAWVFSAPATAQYDSGEITATTTGGLGELILGTSSDVFTVGTPSFSADVDFSPSRNTPININGFAYNLLATNYACFKPIGINNNWNAITKIKVYTNISSDLGAFDTPTINMKVAFGDCYYKQGLDPLDVNNYWGLSDSGSGTYTGLLLTSVVPGTVPPTGVTTNIGDDGTLYGEFVIGTDFIYPSLDNPAATSIVGDKYIGTGTWLDGINLEPADIYKSVWISINLKPNQVLTGVKYRFFLEYM
jgi:hypothetical protein